MNVGSRRVVLACLATTVIVPAGFLFSPAPREPFCGQLVVITGPLRFPLNCDSSTFIRVAIHPGELLDGGQVRQSRPAVIAVAAALTRVAELPFRLVPVPGKVAEKLATAPSGTRLATPAQALGAYLGYALINTLVLLGALLLFVHLVAPPRHAEVAVVAIAALLAANDLVKVYFWSPHTQIFNVVMPLISVAWCRHLYRRPTQPWVRCGLAGGALGLLSLGYGSFVVVLIAGAITLWVRIGLRRALPGAFAMAVGFAVPNMVWVLACIAVSGRYYNHEVAEFREFVWLADAGRLGFSPLLRAFGGRLRAFGATLWRVEALPVACVASLLGWAALRGHSWRRVADGRAELLVPVAATLGTSLVFYGLLGVYATRLSYAMAPPILLLAGLATKELLADIKRRRVATAAIVVAVGSWTAWEVAKRGPFA